MARPKKTNLSIQISVSIPAELLSVIDQMAKTENRNRSNFIRNTFENMARDYLPVRKVQNTDAKMD